MFLAALPLVVIPLVAAEVPGTEIREVRESLHGVEIVDPYRWLEGSAAPELEGEAPELDEKVDEWTALQNAYTRTILDDLPGRNAVEKRLAELLQVGWVRAPEVRRNRYFFWKREGGQRQWAVWMQEGLEGEPRMLIDPNQLDAEGLLALAWTSPSPDGKRMAFGLHHAGDENSVLHVLDVDSGTWLAEEIPGRVRAVSWLPDSRSFFYRRLEDVKDPYSGQIKFHVLGTHHRQDPVLFSQYKEGPLATTWGPYAYSSPDGRWMTLSYWTGTDSLDLWVIDLDRWFRSGEFVRRDIVVGERAISSGPVIGDTLYLQTTLDAPNGRVVAVDLHRPERENWREILPEREDAALRDIEAARGILVAEYLQDASVRLERFRLDGTPMGEIPLPTLGTVQITTEPDRTEAFFTFESFAVPDTVYRLDLERGETEIWARPDVPLDSSDIEVRRVFYSSKDGTRIPMFLVHNRGLEQRSDNPTILYGYGGFNISQTPRFRTGLSSWLEAGGLWAVANLRGGGEYGEKWHRAGMLEQKQNVFDDFIAAAEWLIENRYTAPGRLGIYGGSNGGLLTGAALVQRPDLFGAVLSAVPLLDMLRYQHFLMARYWVPEYGSAENADPFEFLRAYSPYHNVRAGTEYPAVFLTAGANDARVHAAHARKMAARLQAATTSEPEEDPVLLWVERDEGHGRGKPVNLQVRDAADVQMFFRWQLGMLEEE
jgi:prolyl oligopeptidase